MASPYASSVTFMESERNENILRNDVHGVPQPVVLCLALSSIVCRSHQEWLLQNGLAYMSELCGFCTFEYNLKRPW